MEFNFEDTDGDVISIFAASGEVVIEINQSSVFLPRDEAIKAACAIITMAMEQGDE